MNLDTLKTVGITFVAAGLIFAFGLVILQKLYTNATYADITINNDSFTMPALGGNVTLDHANLLSFTNIINGTGSALASVNYSVTTTTGIVWMLENATQCKTAATCYANYKYREYDTEAGVATTAAITAVGEIPNNWFTIIAVVLAGVLILGLVLNGLGQFSGKGGR